MLDQLQRLEHALIAFDFARQQGAVLPVKLTEWRLRSPQDIDAAFARKVAGRRRGADGRELAFLKRDAGMTD